MSDINDLQPVNYSERVMYEQLVRLDALCNMLSSLITHIAKRDEVPTVNNTVEQIEGQVTLDEAAGNVISLDEKRTAKRSKK